MDAALRLVVGLVALEHLWILWLEMFAFRTPLGRRVFRLTPAQSETCAVFAANQGLYNGFLAAGLGWSLLASPARAPALMAFFLGCVAAAGLYGGFTASRRIVLYQAGPALLGLLLLAGRALA
ncbi:MAG: DUF1304 domain-containing protein [Elusimicrobia bacterium]|nr:DUF1304 domain-containing protein [Elusimicrobiota bacterium]